MAKKKKGHEPAERKDPFEMSTEEFKADLDAKKSHADEDTGAWEDDGGPAAPDGGDTGAPPPAGGDAETPPDDSQQARGADTGGGASPETGAQGADDGHEDEFEIVHNGVKHRVTRDKLVELAQKGFDYDQKIGPHRRIVEIVDAVPGAAKALQDYLDGRRAEQETRQEEARRERPKLKPISEFESDEDWLAANYETLQEHFKPKADSEKNIVRDIGNVLISYDPDGFPAVVGHLKDYAENLPHREFNELMAETSRGNYLPMVKFYKAVKEDLEKSSPPASPKPTLKPPAESSPPAPPAFRAKPGGGEPPRNPKDSPEFVWNLPRGEFRKKLQELKGY